MKQSKTSDRSDIMPDRAGRLHTGKPARYAAGLKSVFNALKVAFREMRLFSIPKTLRKMNQVDGFDCPGCAWPDPDHHRSRLGEYCENGIKAIAEEAGSALIDRDFFSKYSIDELLERADHWLGHQGRIAEPMVLRKGERHYRPISWEDAFEMLATALNQLSSPDEAVFYTSGRTSNEAAFLYQLFVRHFGTNNLPDCSNMCHESSGVALSDTLGIGKGSVKLEDFYEAEVIIISGQNPGTNHPRMLTALQKAKRNGCRIISINPLQEAGLTGFRNPQEPGGLLLGQTTQLTDLFLQVRINGDVALAKAICLALLELEDAGEKVFDLKFIEEKAIGFEDYIADLRNYNLNELAKESGVPLIQIHEAARILGAAQKVIACWAMGLTQHRNAVDNITELVNLLLLKGSIGKPGAGTCPVRGHSNVQGDRTVGIWERPKKEFLDKLEENFGFKAPRKHGYDTVNAIDAMAENKVGVFFAMGGNFVSASPDTGYTAKALRNCSLTAHVSTKLNRSHLVHGEEALILPCLGRTETDIRGGIEQIVSVENSMGVVHKSKGVLKPVSELLLSETAIVAGMAASVLGERSKVDWHYLAEDYDRIRDAIESSIPGFENYNQRVRKAGGFYLPNCAREGIFENDVKKAKFTINKPGEIELKEGEFLMMTIRSHDQFNTTIYGLDDRYRGIYNDRRVVFMNPDDMLKRGMTHGMLVNLINKQDPEPRLARNFRVVSYDIPPKCIATYFPEANPLIPNHYRARKSNTPCSKSVPVYIEPVG